MSRFTIWNAAYVRPGGANGHNRGEAFAVLEALADAGRPMRLAR